MDFKKDWRLVSDLVVFLIPNKYRIYFASPEKPSYINAVIKKVYNDCSSIVPIELKLDDNSFNLKLDEELNVLVKSDLLPDKNQYYRVMNFCWSDSPTILGNIISQVENNKGEFKDKFEVIFSDSIPGEISFVSPSMSQYNSYFIEMRRRLNVELNRKTKKWKIGHRYDSLTKTIYYLGEVKSRLSSPQNTEFMEGVNMTTAYLYTSEIDEVKDKKISDILNSRSFGSNIKVAFNQEAMVDCGEVLENDITNFQDYWEELMKNTINSEQKQGSDNIPRYEQLNNILSILSFQTGTDDLKVSNEIKDELVEVIQNVMKSGLLKFWNYNISYIKLNSKQPIEKNVENLIKIFYGEIKDRNLMRESYYNTYFNKVGIDLAKIAKDVLVDWNENDIYSDFDNYVRFIEYTKNHYPTAVKPVNEREKSKGFSNSELYTVANSVGIDTELTNVIIGLFNFAVKKYGVGISEFEYYNIGTKKDPIIYIEARITLDDIIKFLGGIDKMSEKLKQEIISRKFTEIKIQIDKDRVLE